MKGRGYWFSFGGCFRCRRSTIKCVFAVRCDLGVVRNGNIFYQKNKMLTSSDGHCADEFLG